MDSGLAEFFEKYINSNPDLGYSNVSSIMREILRTEVRNIKNELRKNGIIVYDSKNEILIPEGKYSKEEIEERLKKLE